MKYIGVDYGTKRIGVAISDEEASFAFPKEIIPIDGAVDKILEIVSEEDIKGVVFGQSLASNGQDNDLVEKAKMFAKKVESKTSIPIYFEREDFSSVEAHRYQTKKGSRDDSAAAVILQRFLDKKSMQQ
jgi:putative Holliday junction resolvase